MKINGIKLLKLLNNRKEMKKIFLLLISFNLTIFLVSQTVNLELVTSSGESFRNTTYQLDWSIGESITKTHSAGNYILTQGFHHGHYEITAIDNLVDTDVNISVFPNPTSDFVSVKLQNLSTSEIPSGILFLTDLKGKVLLQEKMNKTEKQLDFSIFSPGIYFLSLKQENSLLKTFKIIKN